MAYRFQKWFFDFLSGQGDYLLCFLTHVRLAGRCRFTCSVHFQARGGTVFRGRADLPALAEPADHWEMARESGGTSIRVGREAIALKLDSAGARFAITLPGANLARPEPALRVPGRGRHALEWRPLGLAPAGPPGLRLDGTAHPLADGSSYVDFVRSDIFPYFVPARQVLWGRAVGRELAFTYTVIQGRKERWGTLQVLARHAPEMLVRGMALLGPGPRCRGEAPPEDAGPLVLEGAEGDLRARLEIRPRRPLCVDRFIGPGALSSRSGTAALRFLSRDPRGVKYLADMSLSVGRGATTTAEQVTGIHEHVAFR